MMEMEKKQQHDLCMLKRAKMLVLTDRDTVKLSRVWDRVRSLVYPRCVAEIDAVGCSVLPGQRGVAILCREGRKGSLQERQRRW